MSRQPWGKAELDDLQAGLTWSEFSTKHPARSYDSWEVKRRRVAGGTSGRRVNTRAQRVKAFQAVQALKTLAEFVEESVRG